MAIRIVEFDTVEELEAYERVKSGAKDVTLQTAAKDSKSKLNALKDKIIQMRKSGMTFRQIGNSTGFERSTINQFWLQHIVPTLRKQLEETIAPAQELKLPVQEVFATAEVPDAGEEVAPPQEFGNKIERWYSHGKVVKWKQMRFKPYTEQEIAAVKSEYDKHGEVKGKKLRAIAHKFKVQEGRIVGLYYRLKKEWESTAAQPTNKGSQISQKERDAVAQFYSATTGRAAYGGRTKLAKTLGISIGRVDYILDKIKTEGKLGDDVKKTARQRFIWQRIKALQAQDPKASVNWLHRRAATEWDEHAKLGIVSENGTAKKQSKATVTLEQLEFPAIYPLAEEAIRIFEQMMIDLIAKKHGKIDYYMAIHNLQLRAGREWDYSTWMEFCNQVLANAKKMAQALVGCDSAKIRIEKDGRSLVIKYGGG